MTHPSSEPSTEPSLPAGQRVVVSEFGATPLDALERFVSLVPMPAPDPSTLRPRDVIVAIESASVGWVDLLMTSGQYPHMPKPPYTPGLEYAGVVAWKGKDVGDRIAIGDPVMVDGWLAGPRSLGAYQQWGGWASYGVAPAEAVVFEDSDAGVQAGRAGGFWVVGLGATQVAGAAHIVLPSLAGVTLAVLRERLAAIKP